MKGRLARNLRVGSYTSVREYVAHQKLAQREAFIPLSHRAGHAQVDIGEADACIVVQRTYFFSYDLPHSDVGFVEAYPVETTEAFLGASTAKAASTGSGRGKF